MKTTYLYIKESPKGLKYLGKTEQNPETYLGSGTRWLNHIKKHKIKSEDIKTTILFETNDKILLKEMKEVKDKQMKIIMKVKALKVGKNKNYKQYRKVLMAMRIKVSLNQRTSNGESI